ncbi:MAG: DUF1598 domain-containing protein [Planctomycetota bacterium]|nr:DUF1598 domain-containing protein [Planctomycetota bacterium]
MIDANGVLNNASVDQTGELRRLLAENAKSVPDDLNKATKLRKVSLRRLAEAIEKSRENGQRLPDEIRYLAGLQEIRYVFVYPEKNDIVLAGPGEGWRIDEKGAVVGVESGRPVLFLDDLLVALRTAREAQRRAISCSIDPTAEGLTRLRQHMKQLQRGYRNTNSLGNAKQTFARIEEVLGPQKITVTVVPATSHFARVLVAADFRMKRLAMNFEPSPIPGFPSFLHMMLTKNTKAKNMLPRWWLEPSYETAQRDPSGLAWELGATSVKAMTEADFLSSTGEKKHSGRANPLAQKWADNMTDKYDELAAAEPIFAELQNCMSLAVVGALIAKEDLAGKADVDMTTLMDPTETPVTSFIAPTQVDSKVNAIRKGRDWIISASGGVDINSWAAIKKVDESKKLAPLRKRSASTGDNWWWN